MATTNTSTIERVSTKKKIARPKMYDVIYFNDDFTSFEFVVASLVQIFSYTEEQGHAFAKIVHETGRGVAGTFTYEIAVQKQIEVLVLAKNFEYPLVVEVHPSGE